MPLRALTGTDSPPDRCSAATVGGDLASGDLESGDLASGDLAASTVPWLAGTAASLAAAGKACSVRVSAGKDDAAGTAGMAACCAGGRCGAASGLSGGELCSRCAVLDLLSWPARMMP